MKVCVILWGNQIEILRTTTEISQVNEITTLLNFLFELFNQTNEELYFMMTITPQGRELEENDGRSS